MAKSKTKQAKRALPYVRRAAEDEYVQAQLRRAVSQLRDVYGRLAKQQAGATEDKKLYNSLKGAAVATRKAILRIEEPPPKRRRGRAVLMLLLSGGVAGLIYRARSGGRDQAPPLDASANGSHSAQAETIAEPAPAR
jgi:hypothetical protein